MFAASAALAPAASRGGGDALVRGDVHHGEREVRAHVERIHRSDDLAVGIEAREGEGEGGRIERAAALLDGGRRAAAGARSAAAVTRAAAASARSRASSALRVAPRGEARGVAEGEGVRDRGVLGAGGRGGGEREQEQRRG